MSTSLFSLFYVTGSVITSRINPNLTCLWIFFMTEVVDSFSVNISWQHVY